MDMTDTINPQALKAARVRRGMNQQQLADAIGCTKDTISRWERGKSSKIRSHLRKPLCHELRVEWEKLTGPTDRPKEILDDATAKVSMGKAARASLQLVAERFNVRPREVVDLAPLLFLILAEQSLLERERRLQEIYAAMQKADEQLLANCAHLGGIITARSPSVDNQLHEERESLSKRDVFGRTIKYELWEEGHEGPFVQFIRDLTKDLPKDAVTDVDSFDGDMIESYRIADDTLRECTGISEDDERAEKLLQYIRCGVIDFSECLRVKRAGDESKYRHWLCDELSRGEEESKRLLEGFMETIKLNKGVANEPDASGKASE